MDTRNSDPKFLHVDPFDKTTVKIRNNGTTLRQLGWDSAGKPLILGPKCVLEVPVAHLEKFAGADLDHLNAKGEIEIVKPDTTIKTMAQMIAENSTKKDPAPAPSMPAPQLPAQVPAAASAGDPRKSEPALAVDPAASQLASLAK